MASLKKGGKTIFYCNDDELSKIMLAKGNDDEMGVQTVVLIQSGKKLEKIVIEGISVEEAMGQLNLK